MMCTGDVWGKLRRQRGTQTRGQMLTSVSAKSQLPGGPPALSRDFSQQSRVMFIFGKWSNLDLEQIGRYLKSHSRDSLFQRKHEMLLWHTDTHFCLQVGPQCSPLTTPRRPSWRVMTRAPWGQWPVPRGGGGQGPAAAAARMGGAAWPRPPCPCPASTTATRPWTCLTPASVSSVSLTDQPPSPRPMVTLLVSALWDFNTRDEISQLCREIKEQDW